MHGLRKQVTEAKEGPLELKRKKAKISRLREEEEESRRRERDRQRDRERWNWVLCLKGFYLFFQRWGFGGRCQERNSIEYSSAF